MPSPSGSARHEGRVAGQHRPGNPRGPVRHDGGGGRTAAPFPRRPGEPRNSPCGALLRPERRRRHSRAEKLATMPVSHFGYSASRALPRPDLPFGASPIRAEDSRPLRNGLPLPVVATIAHAVIRCPAGDLAEPNLPGGDPVPGTARRSCTFGFVRAPSAGACPASERALEPAGAGRKEPGSHPGQRPGVRALSLRQPPSGRWPRARGLPPISASCARSMLDSCVPWRIAGSRVRCRQGRACRHSGFTSAQRMDGRVAAAQMASASVAPDLPRFTQGLTQRGTSAGLRGPASTAAGPSDGWMHRLPCRQGTLQAARRTPAAGSGATACRRRLRIRR